MKIEWEIRSWFGARHLKLYFTKEWPGQVLDEVEEETFNVGYDEGDKLVAITLYNAKETVNTPHMEENGVDPFNTSYRVADDCLEITFLGAEQAVAMNMRIPDEEHDEIRFFYDQASQKLCRIQIMQPLEHIAVTISQAEAAVLYARAKGMKLVG